MTILTWDYREQPDWDDVNKALGKCRVPVITVIGTGTQEFAILVHPAEFSATKAQAYYDQHCND